MSAIKNFLKGIRDKILWQKRKKYIPVLKQIIPEDASIFSMNCFAGRIYQDLERKYNTPTAGLFFLPEDFVKISQNISLIKEEIEEVKTSKWKGWEEVVKSHGSYPVGRIKGTDIEIHFLHYPSFEEAVDKWKRRTERFNFNNYYIIGFCQNGWECYPDYFKDFDNIDHSKKILFANGNAEGFKDVIGIESFRNKKDSPDPYKFADVYYKELLNHFSK